MVQPNLHIAHLWKKLVLPALFVFIGILLGDNFTESCNKIQFVVFLFILRYFLLQISTIICEFQFLQSRYNGSFHKLCSKVIDLQHFIFIMFVVLFSVILNSNFVTIFLEKKELICYFAASFLLFDVSFELKTISESQILNWAMSKGLDYGSAMANSFYFGYLKVILRCTGTETKNLQEQLRIFEDVHRVKFLSKKLFILIPISAYCPPDIAHQSKSIEPCQNLMGHEVDRAGVKKRRFQNTVYKIQSGDAPIYICAEYATPVLTLHEVMTHCTAFPYKEHYKEIITSFYVTLNKIIQSHRSCHNMCELILYYDEDEHQRPLPDLDVAELLKERLFNQTNT